MKTKEAKQLAERLNKWCYDKEAQFPSVNENYDGKRAKKKKIKI